MNSYKIAFVTTLSDDFFPGAITTVKSLLHNNPHFKYPIVIFEWKNLSDKNKKILRSIYKNIIFKSVRTEDYSSFESGENRNWNYNFNYRYDIFLLEEYDKIIFFDCDIIFNLDISKLIKIKCAFGAVARPKGINAQIGMRQGFNAGLMIISKKFLNNQTRDDLISISKHSAVYDKHINKRLWIGNEPILNNYFKKFTKIPQKYNFCIDEIKPRLNLQKYNIHFIGSRKPWHNSIDRYVTNKLAEKYGQFFATLTVRRLVNLYRKYI